MAMGAGNRAPGAAGGHPTAVAAPAPRPPSPGNGVSRARRARRRAAEAWPRAAAGGAGGGASPELCVPSLGPGGLRGPRGNFGSTGTAGARFHTATRVPAPRSPARAPSVFPGCFRSHTLK